MNNCPHCHGALLSGAEQLIFDAIKKNRKRFKYLTVSEICEKIERSKAQVSRSLSLMVASGVLERKEPMPNRPVFGIEK